MPCLGAAFKYIGSIYSQTGKVRKLKIGWPFVGDSTINLEDKAIVSAITNKAGTLGIHSIAEGVA